MSKKKKKESLKFSLKVAGRKKNPPEKFSGIPSAADAGAELAK